MSSCNLQNHLVEGIILAVKMQNRIVKSEFEELTFYISLMAKSI